MDDAILRDDAVLRDDQLRLNLDQQKTRAKELRRAVAAGDPQAVARIARHHPDAHDLTPGDVQSRLARLSDAQLVIARELGLPSWPRLKAHVERLARARAAIAGHEAPDADGPTLHLRCGSDIRVRLQQAGFTGDFLEFSNPYCQGPVPRDGDLPAIRARFIADNYLVTEAQAAAKLAAEDDGLARAPDAYQRVVLWFEHDSYDQLILARVLAAFAARRPRVLELICIDRFPVITRFNGLGQLSAAALRMLWDSRTPVTANQLRLGTAVWEALREPSPSALHAIAAGGTPELPLMAAALLRHLQELPWTRDGLSLTQRLALARLHEGPATVADLFRAIQLDDEPLPFLGDLMFWAVLRGMLGAIRPPFAIRNADVPWPQHILSLTPTGEQLVAGELDWMSLQPPSRWVGGIPVGAGAPDWRWSAEGAAPVLRG